MSPALEVVIVSWRCEALLRDCLASLRENPPAGPLRVHVVDNASGDGTAEMVAAEFPEVELTANARNAGFSVANNIALRRVTAPYVLVLNPDTRITAGSLDAMLELMEQEPQIGMCGPRLVSSDGTFDHASRRAFPTPLSALGHFSGIGRRLHSGRLAAYRAPDVERGPVDAVNGAFMLIRRSALDQVGLFDERYWMYMEDLDLCYRFKQAGWTIWFEPEQTVIHEKSGTVGPARSARLNYAFHRGMVRFYRSHYAAGHSALMNGLVYAGVTTKLLVSLLGVAVGRMRWGPPPPVTIQPAPQQPIPDRPARLWLHPRAGLSALKRRVNRLATLSHHPPKPLRVPARYLHTPRPAEPPLISIVTPTLNHARFLPSTIESVLGQNYPALEYVVQDGGSDDGTDAVLDRYAARLHHCDSAPDDGQAHALNLGFERTSGEVMAYLNSDDMLLPGTLDYVARTFRDRPDVDVVYGHRVLVDEDGMEIGRWVLPDHDDEVLSWADFVPQETLFWRRSAWEAAGGSFDESFRFAMDWDVLVRLRDAGSRMTRLPRFLGAFRVHDGQKTTAQGPTLGLSEMDRIRSRLHGREVTQQEVLQNIRPYLIRHVFLDQLYRRGLLRH